MKRREFFSAGVGLVGLAAAARGLAQSKPCPPPTVSAVGGSASSSSCGVEATGGAPAWFTAMDDGTWATPVANTLDAVKPSPLPPGSHQTICTAWTGGAVDPVRGELILAANGGHGDYSGNEVYACAMRAATPRWVRLDNPSSASGGTEAMNSAGAYGDGRPRAVHGWNRCVFGNGKVWYAGLDGMYPSGNWTTACWSYDRGSTAWTYRGLGINPISQSSFSWQGGASAYDPVGNRVWSIAQYATGQGGYSVDASTGAITPYDWYFADNRGGDWMVVAHDTNPRVLIHSVSRTGKIWVLNLEAPANGWTIKTPTGSPSGLIDGAGAVYHAASKSILCWRDFGARIRRLKVPSDPIGGNYAWSEIAPSPSNAIVPPAGPANGTFGKFNLVPDMGNGRSALVLVTSTTGPVYVYKVPAVLA